ncbi:SusD family protein [bacterium A37T11]|nr:SusD family protein [bacterium A37T11]
MKLIKKITACICCLMAVLTTSCQKYLDKKPYTALIIPKTLDDYTRLLDNYELMNSTSNLGEISSDNFYLANRSALEALVLVYQRSAYLFKPDFEESSYGILDWSSAYQQVFIANVVLDGLNGVQRNDINAFQWDFVKGWALFCRSYAFFNLAQLFAPVYDPSSAETDLGIPLRLSPNVDQSYGRATLKLTYTQLIKDFALSADLLPAGLPSKLRGRPCKEAAYAALSRVYLAMRDYGYAGTYAEKSLALTDQLLNYNDLATQSTPFYIDYNNPETICQSALGINDPIFYAAGGSPNTLIDSTLYDSYLPDDLRKDFYYTPSYAYPGKANNNLSYGGYDNFGGFAMDELYLIRSECLIRNNQVEEGIGLLNKLLITRFRTGKYMPYQITDQSSALNTVLAERRKELAFRGLRWQDLRRLNKEGFHITVSRQLDGTVYQLPPNSNLYTLPIPGEEIRLNHLVQNPRP